MLCRSIYAVILRGGHAKKMCTDIISLGVDISLRVTKAILREIKVLYSHAHVILIRVISR